MEHLKTAFFWLLVTVLLVSIFSLRVGFSPVGGDSVAVSDIYATRQTIIDEASLKDCPWSSVRHLSEALRNQILDHDLNFNTESDCKWDPESPEEWKDFSCVDDDSAELIIGFKNDRPNIYSAIIDTVQEYDCEVVNTVSMEGKIAAVVVDVRFEMMPAFILDVETTESVMYIEPNVRFEANSYPNDPDWPKQWGPTKIEADHAWDIQTGDPSVLVAVIDTGLDYNHPDLTANYIPLGFDWANNDSDPMDDRGHGTHCAGIIAATMNNNVGMAGLAQVSIMAEKTINEFGWGWEDDYANAIIHAVEQGADIISCSWGLPIEHWTSTLHEAVKYAYSHDVLLIGTAGNGATSVREYPGGYDEFIAVTATNSNDKPWKKTSFGDWVELAAPGDNIYSTISNVHSPEVLYPYDYASGTSMAAPHVAGVAALIWSQYPNMTRDQVRAQLWHTADDLGYPGFDVYYGYGRINARKAVEQTPLNHDLLISRLETPPYVKLGDMVVINTTVFNFGTEAESNLTVQLLINGSLFDSVPISVLESIGSITVNFSWTPMVEGIHNITSFIDVVACETVTSNNALSISVPGRNGRTFRVPEDYSTIQAAVDATVSGIGDTVRVAAGTYFEKLNINKSLTINGEDRSSTIIDANETKGWIVIIKMPKAMRARIYPSNGLNFTGFTVRNGGNGVHIEKRTSVNFSENVVSDCNGVGVELLWSESFTLRDNIINGNGFNFFIDGNRLSHYIHDIDTSNTVNGRAVCYLVNEHDKQVNPAAGYVGVINCSNITVKDITIENGGQAVQFVCSTDSTVENVSVKKSYIGIELIESSFNIITGNVLLENIFGVFLYSHSNNNNVSTNKIEGNKELAGLSGIVLSQGSSNNIIRRNSILNNTFLMFGYGIRVEYFSNNNTICRNDFINNSVQASVYFSFDNNWDDGYPSGGNYWSDYNSTDLHFGPYQNETGHDGIWDTAYIIDDANRDNYPIKINYGYWADPILGDVNFDKVVNMKDVGVAARAFGSYPNHPRWNPTLDVNEDENIDMRDIATIARNFGETYS